MPLFGKGNDKSKGKPQEEPKRKSKGKGQPTCQHEATWVYLCACGTTVALGDHKRNTENHPDIVRHHRSCTRTGGRVTQVCKKCWRPVL